jgi:glycosyltransferase involved in cell wall biosynthesis
MHSLVSVVIPTYNRRPLLRAAIDSVLAQTYADREIIVVDDGSKDGSAQELAASYGETVQVVTQANRGVAAARNVGVARAAGDYIAFLDSDDLWLPRKLEVQMNFMRRHREWQIGQTEEIWIRKGVRVNPKKKHRKLSGDIFRAGLDLCLVSPSAVLMTRELFDRAGGFDESFPVCEDYDLWLRIAREYPIYLIPQPLVIKRGGHPDQLSKSTWGLDRFRVRAIQKLLDSGIAGDKRKWALEVLVSKAAILAQGARKRGREGDALMYEALVANFIGELEDDGSANSGLLPGQRLPSTDARALARLD